MIMRESAEKQRLLKTFIISKLMIQQMSLIMGEYAICQLSQKSLKGLNSVLQVDPGTSMYVDYNSMALSLESPRCRFEEHSTTLVFCDCSGATTPDCRNMMWETKKVPYVRPVRSK